MRLGPAVLSGHAQEPSRPELPLVSHSLGAENTQNKIRESSFLLFLKIQVASPLDPISTRLLWDFYP